MLRTVEVTGLQDRHDEIFDLQDPVNCILDAISVGVLFSTFLCVLHCLGNSCGY